MLFELMLRDKQKEGYKKGLTEGRSQGIAEGRSQGIAEGRSQGRSQGIAESVLTILGGKGQIPPELSERILQENDLPTLQDWLKLSAEASDVEEFRTKLEQTK